MFRSSAQFILLATLLGTFQLSNAATIAESSQRTSGVDCHSAFRECDFRFSGFVNVVPTFSIGGRANTPFTPRIISTVRGEHLGVLNTNNIIPEFVFDGATHPITSFGSQRFTPTHFKPFSIPTAHRFSGVGHQTFQGNQLSVATGKCIRLYFTHYQLLNPTTGVVVGNRNNVPRSENKCVVFRTRA